MAYMFFILSLFYTSDLTLEQKYNVKVLYSNAEMTKQAVYEYICYKGFREPDKVMKTICFESGHLKSNAALNYNNITGMNWNKRGYAIGKSRTGLAKYKHWTDSIDDLYAWQSNSNGDWYKILVQKGFNQNKSYCKKIERVKIWSMRESGAMMYPLMPR